jgi:hypothetical protein
MIQSFFLQKKIIWRSQPHLEVLGSSQGENLSLARFQTTPLDWRQEKAAQLGCE